MKILIATGGNIQDDFALAYIKKEKFDIVIKKQVYLNVNLLIKSK